MALSNVWGWNPADGTYHAASGLFGQLLPEFDDESLGVHVWMRAIKSWGHDGTGYKANKTGYESGRNIVLITQKRRFAQSINGGPELLDPTTGDPNFNYWTRFNGTRTLTRVRFFVREANEDPALNRWQQYPDLSTGGTGGWQIDAPSSDYGISIMFLAAIGYPATGFNGAPDYGDYR